MIESKANGDPCVHPVRPLNPNSCWVRGRRIAGSDCVRIGEGVEVFLVEED